jgi:hypothetical protein
MKERRSILSFVKKPVLLKDKRQEDIIAERRKVRKAKLNKMINGNERDS